MSQICHDSRRRFTTATIATSATITAIDTVLVPSILADSDDFSVPIDANTADSLSIDAGSFAGTLPGVAWEISLGKLSAEIETAQHLPGTYRELTGTLPELHWETLGNFFGYSLGEAARTVQRFLHR